MYKNGVVFVCLCVLAVNYETKELIGLIFCTELGNGQYIKINGVLPFRSFPRFQDGGVLHSGVTTQSLSNGIIL